jgi:tyrosyl-tRNA synthetase
MNHEWYVAHPRHQPHRLSEFLPDEGQAMVCSSCGERIWTNDPQWESRKDSVCYGTQLGVGNTVYDQQLRYILRHAEQVHTALRLKLLLGGGKDPSAVIEPQLRVKVGMDPTAPELTLGHMVPLRLVRQFQEWGHKAVVIVGDVTACVGDPTGQNVTRPILSKERVRENVKYYLEQISRVLLTDSDHFEMRHNSEWLVNLNIYDIIHLMQQKTVQQLLQKEMFRDRAEVRLHEMLYPLLQGYDSYAVRADVEIGGSDQLFNMLVGRDVQQHHGCAPQVVITTPLLVGRDGIMKMSKSKGNHIPLSAPPSGPDGLFGAIMSIKDSMMPDYFRLLTDVYDEPLKEEAAKSLMDRNPMTAKMQLARTIVEVLHGKDSASAAETDFTTIVQKGKTPLEMPELVLATGNYKVTELLVMANLLPSRSAAVRKIKEGAVKIDGVRINEQEQELIVDQRSKVIQLGKRRYVRVRVAQDDLPITG